jgi:photosystem II stability/assembly factor-like uncharacterized protein
MDSLRHIGLLVMLTTTAGARAEWQMQQSGSHVTLRGIHAVSAGVAWASGAEGTVLRTEDGGYVWQRCSVPEGAEKLDFRGIWGWDAKNAIVMSSGPGKESRLYKTTDGCNHWRLLVTNSDEKGFWDAIAFVGAKNGTLVGDPVDGRFVVAHTNDAGEHWRRSQNPQLAANPGETVFSASNSALFAPSAIAAVFGTGGTGGPRIFTGVTVLGEKWKAVDAPLAKGTATSGVFSIAFRDGLHGVAVGGDFAKPADPKGSVALTTDGGITWQPTPGHWPRGYRSAVAYDASHNAWICGGTTGTDFSLDDGRTWQRLDDGDWNGLSLPYIVGPKGKIARLVSLAPQGPERKQVTKADAMPLIAPAPSQKKQAIHSQSRRQT